MTAVDERPPAIAPAELLRRTLRRHAAGVVVITAPGPVGLTVTSFTSVSLDPALVSFYLSTTASTAPALRAAEAFTVHVLHRGQEELARAFARSGVDRFAGVPWTTGPHGTPLLAGVTARLTARQVGLHPVGDHLLVVGEVVAADADGGEPLVHHDGGFGGFAPGAGEGPWR
ncbi:flavin reductase family protein [Streptomyces sp. TLI_171]|uniref:flavin reductase family protein n=1 Tax=Streptomyces sp. TLI_171 TaxID=1938859 RepID=UPI000C1A7579|nr:flavin reductase family protein [Streptomyces sp. TLI_171]RKE23684.1 flavin reductase (DIM6/NTAB) family NADH-FMN oxidoreductase RutF [Streptomyces sp. TLI_171]